MICIQKDQYQTWCGRGTQWRFLYQDIDHAIKSATLDRSERICSECIEEVLKTLTDHYDPTST